MTNIVWSQRCRKCKGQLYLEDSEDGVSLVCIQCGHSERIIDEELNTFLSTVELSRNKDTINI